MDNKFESLRKQLYEEISGLKEKDDLKENFNDRFFQIIDIVNFSLMEDSDNFYGHFLLHMKRNINLEIATPTGITASISDFTIYFNPLLFTQCSLEQMQGQIKHEIHHILSLHLNRAKDLKKKYSTLALNIAMDLAVNQYIDNLPPYSINIDWVNLKYGVKLEPFNTMEYYANKIQEALNLLDEDSDSDEDDTKINDEIADEYNPETTHDIWEFSEQIDEKLLKELTKKYVDKAWKGDLPVFIDTMIKDLNGKTAEISWNIYLKRLMGNIPSGYKKTITRRNRRQPERYDLRGALSKQIAKITIAIDISGSISDEEIEQAFIEIFSIVKNYKHKITIVECDSEIRRVYIAKSIKDLKKKVDTKGGTKFSPVFDFVNKNKSNILIYFTDGEGEERLEVTPKGYKTLWIISGRGDKLSLTKPFGVVKKLKRIEVIDNIDMYDVRTDGWSMNSQQPVEE